MCRTAVIVVIAATTFDQSVTVITIPLTFADGAWRGALGGVIGRGWLVMGSGPGGLGLSVAGSAGGASTLFANRTELLVLFNLDKLPPEEVNLGLQRFWWLSTPCFCPATSVLDSRQDGGDR